jgi:hypothetical protein
MQNNNIDIIKILENKLQGKSAQIVLGQLGNALVKTSEGAHRDVVKALVEADEKAAVSAITGIDLGVNFQCIYYDSSRSSKRKR